MSSKINKKLTPKEKRFVDFYVTSAKFNATIAHELAGYNASDENARRAAASRLRAKANITAKIDEFLIKEHENNLELKTEIRRLYEAILKADYDKLIQFRVSSVKGSKADGEKVNSESYIYSIPDLSLLDDNLRKAIKVIKKTANGFTLELYDKMKAAEELRKMYGFDLPLKTNLQLSGKDGGPIETKILVEYVDIEDK